jgi:PPOX class probable F420-dependent enzyme
MPRTPHRADKSPHAVGSADGRQRWQMKLPSELTDFLAKPRIAVLATVGRTGAPATTACWYDLEDGKLLITMYADARRLQAIIDNPRVAMTIVGDDPYQHVSLAGRVEKRWPDPELRVMDRLSMRYMGEPWQERNPCVSALVEIDRWHTYGLLSEASDYSSSTP